MKLAIVGTGNVGQGLAWAFANTDHEIIFGARDMAKGKEAAAAFQKRTGFCVDGTSVAEAVSASDVIFLAIPYTAAQEVIAAAGNIGQRPVVDVTNPLTDDFMALTLGFVTSAAEEIQRLVDAPVTKAFNTIFAQIYSEGPQFGDRAVQTFLAGDDAKAKSVVANLATDAGFDVIDTGPLSNSRYLEPLAVLNIQLGYGQGRGTQFAPLFIERPKSSVI